MRHLRAPHRPFSEGNTAEIRSHCAFVSTSRSCNPPRSRTHHSDFGDTRYPGWREHGRALIHRLTARLETVRGRRPLTVQQAKQDTARRHVTMRRANDASWGCEQVPISLRRIKDLSSFKQATSSPRETAALYFFKQLDPVYDNVLAIAGDLFARPQLYTNGDSAAAIEILAKYRSRVGSDELIPSREQRLEIYGPLFGPHGAAGSFDKLRDDLLRAVTAFSERVFDSGVDMLRERVRTAHRPLKEFLTGLTGASIVYSAAKPLPNIAESISFTVLRVPEIDGVFGVTTPPNESWPYAEDSNADKLLEETCLRLNVTPHVDRQIASNLQRVAARGAEAIAAVLDYTENSADPVDDIASLDVLITACYTWGAAKMALA
jgi:hypothetical protein